MTENTRKALKNKLLTLGSCFIYDTFENCFIFDILLQTNRWMDWQTAQIVEMLSRLKMTKKNAQLWKGWVTLLNNIKFSNIHMNWCTPYQNDIYVINLSIIIFLEVELTADYSQRGIIIMGNFKKLCGRISCVITISFTFVTIICTIVMMYMIHFGRLKES